MKYAERYNEIDIAKGIGILLVVIGHAVPDANTGIKNYFWGGVFTWIYSFHMALFMAMAGVLFYRKISDCTNLSDKIEETKKRAIRLLLPYCTFSIIILIAKLLFATWSREPVSAWNAIGILFGSSPCGNMWFLWTLFMISLIIMFLPKTRYFPLPLIMFATVMYFFQNQQIWFMEFGLGKISNMLIWFAVGLLIGKKIKVLEKARDLGTNVKAAFLIAVLLIQIAVLELRQNLPFQLVYKYILAILGILLTLSVSVLLAGKNGKVARGFQYLGKNSMSIYVLSYFIQTPGVTIYRKIGSCGIPYDLWVVSLVVLALLFSVIAAKVIRKNAFLRMFILGER